MKCPECQFDNREGVNFCEKCGATLELKCPNCKAAIPPDRKFCGICGRNLTDFSEITSVDYSEPQTYTPKFLADKILTTRNTIEGERKLVTVLFADVANYTAMSEKLDPEEVHSIMDGCFEILMAEIHKYEGTINQFTGDGIMAIFGAPVAHEDHAQRACNSALSIQRILQNFGDKIIRDRGIDFKMRIGLNSGLVVVGSIGDDLRMDYTAIGDTTNLAARIQQASNPGEVWMSKDTRNIVRDYFQDELIGDILLKGKSQPQPVYLLITGSSTVRTRFEAGLVRGITEFVGRSLELEALHSAFERAKKGEAQVFDIIGEAGVGKSRLVYEFNKTLCDNAIFFTGLCVHYGLNINYLPVIDIVREAFEISEGMAEEDAARKIEENAVDDLIPMIPFYQNLLSITVKDSNFDTLNPEGRKFGTFEAVKQLLLVLSKKKPLVVFLEDVHWMDKISEELFTYFSRAFLEHPILMITNYRPECTPQWAQGAHYQRLGLETLSSKSSIKLIHNILGGVALEPHLEKTIVERTGGNPFFVEEIVRELIDRKDLLQRGDKFVSNLPIDRLEIPRTIQGVLAARMDRLSEDLKQTMQVASVIGRDFAFRLLKSIMEFGDEIRGHLSNLVGLEILCEKALYPELEYIFKHALTQEVAYESLLKQRRKEIHALIAKAIEELYAEQLEEHYELLAYHYERSGNSQKTVNYLILAGEKSVKNGAAQAACDFFDEALKVAENQNILIEADTKARVHLGLAEGSFQIGAIGKCAEQSRIAAELSRQYGMIDYERDSLSWLANVMHMWPVKAEAEKSYEEGLARAREIGDKGLESVILSSVGVRAAMDGEPYKGYKICVKGEKLALETDDFIRQIATRVQRAYLERWIGHPATTIELTEGLTELARQTGYFSVLGYIVSFRGLALSEVGRISEGIKTLKFGIDICEEFGVFIRLGCLYNCMGYSYGEIHQIENALTFNRKAEEIARSLMEKYPMGRQQYAEMVAQSKVNLIENQFDQGNVEKAWDILKKLEKETSSTDYDWFRHQWESRMNYLASKILLHRKNIDQAESSIVSNLDKANKNHMRKREGSFLRLLGELQIGRNEFDNAINTLSKAIQILKEVGNPRKLWQVHASLAEAYKKLERFSESKAQLGAAAEIILNTANDLSDRQLKEGFLKAEPIRKTLSIAES
jgi:class 3 adenylate cyclase/tetratricopeptide (TPR) repeat protein